MAVFAIWEFHYPAEAVAEGRGVTEAIWTDMLSYDGYVRHVIIEDLDDPGHLFVLSEWKSRADADRVRAEYRVHPNAQRADELVARPRGRTVGQFLTDGAGGEPQASVAPAQRVARGGEEPSVLKPVS